MNLPPAISVILPVYNAVEHLQEAISSILTQTFSHFELMIINDGSTDESEKIILSFKDPRIRYIRHETNRGLVETLNSAVQSAQGKYIARMDADDICLPERFAQQYEYLEKHPQVGVLGTFFIQLRKEKKRRVSLPVRHEEIHAALLFKSPVAHPSVMIRTSVLKKMNSAPYNPSYQSAEDYELWTKLAVNTRIENLPKPLLVYRIHPSQMTQTNASSKEILRKKIMLRELNKLSLYPNQEEMAIHHLISSGLCAPNKNFLAQLEKWFLKIKISNDEMQQYDASALRKVLSDHWISACGNSGRGISAWYYLLCSEFSGLKFLSMKKLFNAMIKILIRYHRYP